MCDKCSQLGSFHAHWSRSLFRDCRLPLPHRFTRNRRVSHSPTPPPPKPLSHPTLGARPLGHGGVEQLLLHCDISTKIIQGERECKEVGTECRKTKTQISMRGTGLDGAIMRTRRIAGHFGSTSGPDEAESCCSSGEFTN